MLNYAVICLGHDTFLLLYFYLVPFSFLVLEVMDFV